MGIMISKSQRIYDEAKKYLGTKEVAGAKSNPLIRKWIAQAASWLNPDDSQTAWCGCFRGSIGLDTATGVPKEHYRASSWEKWGEHIPWVRDMEQGDTLIFKRPGGYHVTLFSCHNEDGTITCLGGNQGDAVTLATYKTEHLEAIRR